MDKETIQQIAVEVVHRLPYGDHPWLFLLVTAALMALVAGVAAWAGAFLKIKGEHFATKRDFDELQKQLKANTELVETIKSDVSQRDWARREWNNLLRLKLEALLEKMHECDADLKRRHLAVFRGSPLEDERDYITEFINPLNTILTLYLPDLSTETDEFRRQCLREHFAIVALDQALRDAGDDSAARERAFDDFKKGFGDSERLRARFALESAARTLLKRIMNVDEGA